MCYFDWWRGFVWGFAQWLLAGKDTHYHRSKPLGAKHEFFIYPKRVTRSRRRAIFATFSGRPFLAPRGKLSELDCMQPPFVARGFWPSFCWPRTRRPGSSKRASRKRQRAPHRFQGCPMEIDGKWHFREGTWQGTGFRKLTAFGFHAESVPSRRGTTPRSFHRCQPGVFRANRARSLDQHFSRRSGRSQQSD